MYKWAVMKNANAYQIWRQTRELDPGEPMHSGVRETRGWFYTQEEAQAFADEMNENEKTKRSGIMEELFKE